MTKLRVTAPAWLRVVSWVLLLWSLAALSSFWVHLKFDPNDPANPAYDRRLYLALPGWLDWVYAVAVGTTFAGAVALLARRRAAVALFAVSLVAVVIQFGWVLSTTDLIVVKGWSIAAGPPAVIVGMTALGLWVAARAQARGWIA